MYSTLTECGNFVRTGKWRGIGETNKYDRARQLPILKIKPRAANSITFAATFSAEGHTSKF